MFLSSNINILFFCWISCHNAIFDGNGKQIHWGLWKENIYFHKYSISPLIESSPVVIWQTTIHDGDGDEEQEEEDDDDDDDSDDDDDDDDDDDNYEQ